MTSAVILLGMGAVLWGILWGARWWLNRRQRQRATRGSRETQELQALVDSFKGTHAASKGILLAILGVGVIVATGVGALFISLMANGHASSHAPARKRITRPERLPGMKAMDVRPMAAHGQVVIVVTEDGAEPLDKPLEHCEPGHVAHVRHDGVRCHRLESPEATRLLRPHRLEQRPAPMELPAMRAPPPVMQQGMAPAVGKDVAKRKGFFQRYAEIVYFLSTFLGVALRFAWDHNLERRRCEQAGRTVERFDLMNLVVGFFIGVAVHLLMSKAMGVGYEKATFQNVLLASYNGFLWPSILKEVSEFRELRKSDGTAA
jgi:hypothetical protein